MFNRLSLVFALIFVLASAVSAQAAFTVYTDQSQWETASGGSSVEDFNSATPETWTTSFSKSFSDFVLAGISEYEDSTGDHTVGIYNDNALFSSNYISWIWSINRTPTPPEGIKLTITFSKPRTAVAFDWVDKDNLDTYSVTIDGTTWNDPPFVSTDNNAAGSSGGMGSGFWGVVSDTPFTTITFAPAASGGTCEKVGFDNVRYGAAYGSSAPLPGWAIVLLAAALLSIGWFRVRKQ